MATTIAALLAAYAVILTFQVRDFKSNIVRELTTLAKVLGDNLQAAIAFNVAGDADKILTALRHQVSVDYAEIRTAEGTVLADYRRDTQLVSPVPQERPRGRPSQFTRTHLHIVHDVTLNNVLIGTVYIRSDLRELTHGLRNTLAVGVVVLLLTATGAFFLATRLQRTISAPILSLAAATEKVSAGLNYDIRVKKESEDEIGTLYERFNTMMGQIQSRETARELAVSALRESEERFRALFEQGSVGVAVLDLNTSKILEINQEYCRITGYSREEMLELDFMKITHQDDLQESLDNMAKLTAGDIPEFTMDKRYRRKDGTIVWVTLGVSIPRIDQQSKNIYFAVVSDITRRKQAEKEKLAIEQKLKTQHLLSIRGDRLRSLGEMAAGIAHELNQPLFGIRLSVEHMLIGMDRGWELTDTKVRHKLSGVIGQVDRMSQIINHIRVFSREADKPETSLVQANDVVNSAVNMLGTQLKAHGLALEVELADDVPLVSANPYSLEEVLLNLLSNARAAVETRRKTEPDANPRPIILRTLVDHSGSVASVKIEVTDSGVGIPNDVRLKVFDPFFTTKAVDEGTGLGLSISKSIIDEFGGSIDIQSTPGEGTTVVINLPTE